MSAQPKEPKDISLVPFGTWLATCGLFILMVVLTAGGLAPIGWVFVALALMCAAVLWMRRTRLRFERLYPPGVELVPLTDSPEDGFVEERGWIPLGLAATPEEAIEVLRDAYPEFERNQKLVVTGRSFHRPDPHVGTEGHYFILDPDGTETHHGYTGHWSEWVTWQACGPDDERAVECWDIEVQDDEPEEGE